MWVMVRVVKKGYRSVVRDVMTYRPLPAIFLGVGETSIEWHGALTLNHRNVHHF